MTDCNFQEERCTQRIEYTACSINGRECAGAGCILQRILAALPLTASPIVAQGIDAIGTGPGEALPHIVFTDSQGRAMENIEAGSLIATSRFTQAKRAGINQTQAAKLLDVTGGTVCTLFGKEQLEEPTREEIHSFLREHAHIRVSVDRIQQALGGTVENIRQQCDELCDGKHQVGPVGDDDYTSRNPLSIEELVELNRKRRGK